MSRTSAPGRPTPATAARPSGCTPRPARSSWTCRAGRKLGRLSLYSAKTAHRQIRWLPRQPVTRTGALVIRTTSSKAVYVDGVMVAH